MGGVVLAAEVDLFTVGGIFPVSKRDLSYSGSHISCIEKGHFIQWEGYFLPQDGYFLPWEGIIEGTEDTFYLVKLGVYHGRSPIRN